MALSGRERDVVDSKLTVELTLNDLTRMSELWRAKATAVWISFWSDRGITVQIKSSLHASIHFLRFHFIDVRLSAKFILQSKWSCINKERFSDCFPRNHNQQCDCIFSPHGTCLFSSFHAIEFPIGKANQLVQPNPPHFSPLKLFTVNNRKFLCRPSSASLYDLIYPAWDLRAEIFMRSK